MNRRTLLKKAAVTCAGFVAAPMLNRGAFQLSADSSHKYSARAIDLVQRSTVIDMQNPFCENWSGVFEPVQKGAADAWFHDPALFKAEDFQKFKASGLTILQTGTSFALPDPPEIVLKYFASWNGLLAHSSDWLMRVDTPERLDAVKNSGKLGIILGQQNSDEPTTIEDVLDHFEHVARLVGVEYVGVGNDSPIQPDDAISAEERKKQESYYKPSYGFRAKFYIEGLNHPQRAFDLTEGLIRRRYSDEDIEKILGGNFKRVLSQIWV